MSYRIPFITIWDQCKPPAVAAVTPKAIATSGAFPRSTPPPLHRRSPRSYRERQTHPLLGELDRYIVSSRLERSVLAAAVLAIQRSRFRAQAVASLGVSEVRTRGNVSGHTCRVLSLMYSSSLGPPVGGIHISGSTRGERGGGDASSEGGRESVDVLDAGELSSELVCKDGVSQS